MRRKPWVSYQEFLLKSLKDPEEASAYLNAALEAGDRQAFLLALKNVLDAQGGMTKIAQKAKMNRVSLYKMLSRKGNPAFDNIFRLLQISGIRFQLIARKSKRRMEKSK